MIIRIDLETYSEVDLKETGVFPYAEHPSTDVLCAAWIIDAKGEKPIKGTWRRGDPPPLRMLQAADSGYLIEAHNVKFDCEIWRQILTVRYGWPWPGYDQFRCSMAKGLVTNLPGALNLAAQFFGQHQKDMAGSRLMKALCKPARKTKNLTDVKRHHTPQKLEALEEYCVKDVLAERSLSRLTPKLSKFELEVWQRTQEMNRRGVRIDVPLATECLRIAEEMQTHHRDEFAKVTRGEITSEFQRTAFAHWLVSQGADLPKTTEGNPSLNKHTRDMIVLPEDGPAKDALAIYDILNKSSVAKIRKMLTCLCSDGRVRGMTEYAGAGQTARWAGRDVQLQNMPRGMLKGETDYEFARWMLLDGASADDLAMIYNNPLDVVSSLIRMCIIPEDGNVLVSCDYSAIEGRVLAWLAEEEHILQAYRDGKRLYAVAAAGIHGCTYEDVMTAKANGDSSMDLIGKIAELACGFGGAHGAFMQFGGKNLGLSDDRIKQIVQNWRDDHPRTTEYWRRHNRMALKATQNPGRRATSGQIIYGHNGDDLKMRLRSGRNLWYRKAVLGEKKWPDGGTSPQVEFYGVEDKKVGRLNTYGGKLTENEVQATAREIMANGFLNAEREGIPNIFSVHDELIAEVPEDQADEKLALMRETMLDVPDWAAGLPLDAEGWYGGYYRKD